MCMGSVCAPRVSPLTGPELCEVGPEHGGLKHHAIADQLAVHVAEDLREREREGTQRQREHYKNRDRERKLHKQTERDRTEKDSTRDPETQRNTTGGDEERRETGSRKDCVR